MRHDIERAAGLDAGRQFLALEMHRNINGNARSLAKAQEIHMHDEIAHGFKLHVARDGADDLAFHFEVDKRRQEAAGLDVGFELAVIERNHLGSLLVAINDTGNETFATYCAGGPLACPATLRGLKLNDLGHF